MKDVPRNERLHNAIAAVQGMSMAMQIGQQLRCTSEVVEVIDEPLMRQALANLMSAVHEETTRTFVLVREAAKAEEEAERLAAVGDLDIARLVR
jgi:adenosylcobinamide amidohydrolase